MSEKLLEINNLKTHFFTEAGVVPSVDDVSFSIKKGEIVAVVGESGSGKSVTSLSIMNLLDKAGKVVNGEILFDGKDLTKASEKELRNLRGDDIAMIFQEPLTSLNPVFTIGNQMMEPIRLHLKLNKKDAKARCIEMLDKVGIPRAEKVFDSFPHSLSGGMRQRVMIAMALSCNPMLLIADEPTTALDVTIQAQILNLMRDIVEDLGTAILLITHDLGVVAEMADKVVVMYAGQVVEYADVFTLFKNPKHPYTQGLIESTPKINQLYEKLHSIPGTVPNPLNYPSGCRFVDRCPFAMKQCITHEPNNTYTADGHTVKCWLHEMDRIENETLKEKVRN
ncbi:dipeptide/oligopeptide/nickel ABC transporter ATP-binding protein [Jeotgalicoccus coquinae]|uniref:Oligopeptide transport ATP-binding protein OppD n=1 Tax=Jeotgalicoccus coquinae TaxID=709509 RepID=A0A6V7RPX7_9STAP|nr:ABC transporter ATP-binding protein [Jeotgalicoccus coquinae]MBB6423975.1 peptide/nickel transport system ATP-binding protein/oligopeptide transport system ATP-binding protein [Jeotgalicoccus coquinae]GGE23511.1 dipeptide/oligopeptide/nickel ABC transporter ATP-binding protein [Jeotgalicoccus coquinae]CAD2080224.1 Oligopeptide transport ATP-binding protein OppD [Jeotgalicoccus coquinae]